MTGGGSRRLIGTLRVPSADERHPHRDRASGARDDRPGLEARLAEPRAGDSLVGWRLGRLGRSPPHLPAIVEPPKERGTAARPPSERIDTASPQGGLPSSAPWRRTSARWSAGA